MDENGNNAAMRGALLAVKKSIDSIGASSLDCDPVILMASLTQVCARLSALIDAALSAPARNCDVGTAEEQAMRFDNDYCFVEVRKQTCVFCKRHDHSDCIKCFAKWAQMPYEEEHQMAEGEL